MKGVQAHGEVDEEELDDTVWAIPRAFLLTAGANFTFNSY